MSESVNGLIKSQAGNEKKVIKAAYGILKYGLTASDR